MVHSSGEMAIRVLLGKELVGYLRTKYMYRQRCVLVLWSLKLIHFGGPPEEENIQNYLGIRPWKEAVKVRGPEAKASLAFLLVCRLWPNWGCFFMLKTTNMGDIGGVLSGS